MAARTIGNGSLERGDEVRELRTRILVVDDSDATRHHVLSLLSALSGVETLDAASGIDALRMIRAGGVSLVLCDYAMPDVSGLQVLHAIRQVHSALELPVLMLTSTDDPEVKLKAFRAGANDYIAKQSAPEEFLARVGTQITLLRSQQRLAAERLRKAEWEKFAAVGQLAEGLAHELNTPAQYIASNLAFMSDGVQALARVIEHMRQLLQGPELKRLEAVLAEVDHHYLVSELPHALAESRGGIDHVASIVAVMREFSRPSSQTRELYDLNEIVRSAATVTRGQWTALVELELQLADGLPAVECVGPVIKQLVLKAIMDALTAIASEVVPIARARLRLCTSEVDGPAGHATRRWVQLAITRSGPPLDPAQLERVMHPVLGLHAPEDQALSHARSVIEDEHEGRFEVSSAFDAGTQLIMQLPLVVTGASGRSVDGTR
jgi:two-component system, NtrC family, sensor kinase